MRIRAAEERQQLVAVGLDRAAFAAEQRVDLSAIE
jgi:hypothetical protein